MRKFVIVVVAAIAMALLLLAWPSVDKAPRIEAGTVSPAQVASIRDPRSAAVTTTAASSVPWRQPPPGPVHEFNPPVFTALPGGLNDRTLKDIYDELVGLAEKGDAEAARVLGDLVVECGDMVEQLRSGRRYGSDNPLVQKRIEEYERVAGRECPTLGDEALRSASKWYMLGAEGGDRQALMRLRFHAPRPTEPDVEAKARTWRTLLVDRLTRLGNDGDFEAMSTLARFYFGEGKPESTKEAYLWFDKASRAPVDADRIEPILRMRDIARQRIAADEQRGR